MTKKRIFQYYWDNEIKSIILFWGILWFSLSKEVTEHVTGYAFTITLFGLNITFKVGKHNKGMLKPYGIS